MTRFRSALAALAFAGLAATARPQEADPIRRDLFFLAGPECEGRGVETKGIEKAADHIARTFRDAGLRPAFKDGAYLPPFTIAVGGYVLTGTPTPSPLGAYFQPFTIPMGAKLGKPNALAFAGPKGEKVELGVPDAASPMGFSRTGKMGGGLAFVGHGITAPKLNFDDYAGLDAAGKVVVVVRKTPRADQNGKTRFDTTVPEGEDSPFAALQAKIENAAAQKAAGVLFVSDRAGAGMKDDLFAFAAHASGTTPAAFPVFHVKREAVDKLLAAAGKPALADLEAAADKDLKPGSFDLGGWAADGEVTVTRTEQAVKNVVGVLDGAGPLANETVVIGAHYDHLGYGTFGSLGGSAAGGKVHFGADDNGSGTAGLLELARRFGAMKERRGRRLVFVAFSAEERGLHGSIHYCKEPPFPLASTVGMLNMDMIGRVTAVPADWLGVWPERKDRLVLYGTGTGDTFDRMVDDANDAFGFRLFKIPGGNAPTDSDSFYRKKVPVLFFFSGTHSDYHRPTDTPDKVNLAGLRRVVDLTQLFAEQLAAGPRPKYQVTKGGWEDPTDPRQRSPGRPGPKMGIMPGNYEEEDKGVLIGGTTPGGAADKAGLKENDLIVEIGGKPVKNIGGYMTAMAAQKAGTAVDVKVLRKGKELTVSVTPQ